jgi:hypothetical protein
MTYLQKYALDNIAKEGPGNTAEWKNVEIIAEKKGFTFDEERIETSKHNYTQHKKQNDFLTIAQNVKIWREWYKNEKVHLGAIF